MPCGLRNRWRGLFKQGHNEGKDVSNSAIIYISVCVVLFAVSVFLDKGKTIEAVRKIRDEIKGRVVKLFNEI